MQSCARAASASGVVASILLLASATAAESDAQGEEIADDLRPDRIGRYFTWEYWRDWHIGLTASYARRPYEGVDDALIPLPLVTRVTDYHFTGQRVFGREGVVGFRAVRAASWEFAVIGGFQGFGYEADDSAALAGMSEREWSVEGGVLGAFRKPRWYVELWGLTDVLGRHEGETYTLAFGVPWRSDDDRLQLIPHLDVVHRSADLVDYYFGVEPGEARAGRPAYAGESATSLRLALRGAWRLGASRWALRGSMRYERLPSAVRDSPIVDDDEIFGINLGVGYRFGKRTAPARAE